MKTPRNILFARHQAAAPKLDALRREVVAELNNQGAKTQSLLTSFAPLRLCVLNNIWLELVWPCRRIWTGLAAVWLLILTINLAQHEPSPAGKMTAAPAMMSFREQQRWMNELFADRAPTVEAEPPKTFSPKPRTENYQPLIA
ncbi:MAG: hypothetical protein PHY43_04020 [Verrucomicrobiales bacterium]|nr:hypothetical protein [Verrucomicrobiales bacterium]